MREAKRLGNTKERTEGTENERTGGGKGGKWMSLPMSEADRRRRRCLTAFY